MALMTCLRIGGTILLLLALAHFSFAERFHWAEELPRLSLINRQIFLVHTFFIAMVVTMMGILSLVFPELLVDRSPLARLVLAGLAIFWGTRLVFQWFVYDRALWRGDRFNTAIHFLFTTFWTYLTSVYAWALWQQFN
jgi:hypothetical protein